ncbi:MAG: hypothetical protein B7733_07945 [Myxococcales bacterium FL481]|nr:MAG: hypothetical protein B7733_07945 [Myxococcales bacterium FL481]
MDDALRYLGPLIELIGLLLITVELYLSRWADELKRLLEGETVERRTPPGSDARRWQMWHTIVVVVSIWVVAAALTALWSPALALAVNVAFTLVALFFGLVSGVVRLLIRLGVALGRGNPIGGLGLVLALIGFALEMTGLLGG